MKNKLSKLLILCLVICLMLTACGGNKTTIFSCEGLTVEIPKNYSPVSSEEAQAYTFALANKKTTIMGLREEKALFEAYGMDLTLEEYAQLIQSANEKSMSVSTYNDQIMMNFKSTVNGETFEYLASVYESEDAFWLIQCACLQEYYEEYRGDFFSQLLSVNPG